MSGNLQVRCAGVITELQGAQGAEVRRQRIPSHVSQLGDQLFSKLSRDTL